VCVFVCVCIAKPGLISVYTHVFITLNYNSVFWHTG